MLSKQPCISPSINQITPVKSDDIWCKFNAPKHIIQKHQKEMIEALSELEGIEIYSQLKHVYNNVFNENAIYEEDNKK